MQFPLRLGFPNSERRSSLLCVFAGGETKGDEAPELSPGGFSMTYYEEDGQGEVVPELGVRFGGGDVNEGYVKLRMGPDECRPGEGFDGSVEPSSPISGRSWWYWARLVLLVLCGSLLAGVSVKWIGPFFMDKVCNLLFFSFRVGFSGSCCISVVNMFVICFLILKSISFLFFPVYIWEWLFFSSFVKEKTCFSGF